MNYTILVVLASFLFIHPILSSVELPKNLHSDCIVLMNADTGNLLFEKNAHKRRYPASITKIATAIYALHLRGDKLDKMITAEHDCVASISEEELKRSNYTLPAYWLIPGASHIGIKRGEELSLEALLYGNLVASGGDASNVIAYYIGGTIPQFMKLLNEYLQELGCQNTTFKNPHGLHHPDHMTTAYDMAILTREAMKNPTFRKIVKTVSYQRPQTNKQKPSMLIQTNRLLKKGKHYYSKAIGVKTGYTSSAQHTLVAAATDGERTLIAVLLYCKDREDILTDAITLFEHAFKEKRISKCAFKKGLQKFSLSLPHASKKMPAYLEHDVHVNYYPTESSKITCRLKWNSVELPIVKGQPIGEIYIEDQRGLVLAQEPVLASENADFSMLYRTKKYLGESMWLKVLGSVLGFFVIIGLIRR